jgi:hypothetical protein
MNIEDLLNYINENLADGTLHMDSMICVKDFEGTVPADSFYNDADELIIGAIN